MGCYNKRQLAEKKYVYNIKQHTLHLTNYCKMQGSPNYDNNWVFLDSKDKAYALDGESVHFCKICARIRDKG